MPLTAGVVSKEEISPLLLREGDLRDNLDEGSCESTIAARQWGVNFCSNDHSLYHGVGKHGILQWVDIRGSLVNVLVARGNKKPLTEPLAKNQDCPDIEALARLNTTLKLGFAVACFPASEPNKQESMHRQQKHAQSSGEIFISGLRGA